MRPQSDASVFQAIACPTRRALLAVLAAGESNVSDLVEQLDVTQSAVSQQLLVLKNAGLVSERQQGRYRLYHLRAEPLAEVQEWVGRYRALIEQQLDRLGQVLDALPDLPEREGREQHKPRRQSPRTPSRRRRPEPS